MASIVAACDRAFLVRFAETMDRDAIAAVRRLTASLARRPIAGVLDAHPAYASVLVTFDPLRIDPAHLEEELVLRTAGEDDPGEPDRRTVVVPVTYGGAAGPDLDDVARHTGLDPAEIVRRHAAPLYEVVFVGFTPGFPYLSGLDPALATPRQARPRRRVPAGSVAIASAQAGIYPVASPAGWNVIGRTDLVLFDPAREPLTLFSAGDRVQFVDVTAR